MARTRLRWCWGRAQAQEGSHREDDPERQVGIFLLNILCYQKIKARIAARSERLAEIPVNGFPPPNRTPNVIGIAFCASPRSFADTLSRWS
jgi:hypothetical protein